jgi:uridine kinase
VRTLAIGISGPSGVGKSTVAQAVASRISGAVVIEQDWYFRQASEYPPDANFCELRWLHLDEFAASVSQLADGKQVDVPVLDYSTFNRIGTRRLGPAPVVVVEGMTIYRIPSVDVLFNLRYYLTETFDIIADRKRLRDSVERNKSAEIIDKQLRWISDEYERDAELRDRADVVVLHPDSLADRVLADVSAIQ